MDNNHFKTTSAVLILLTRETTPGKVEYLLQKRQNTGFADGMWDFSASGHVEKNEPMTKTVCREAKEEIGIDINPNDIEFMGLLHSFDGGEPRFLGCFKINKYLNEPYINEPDKIAELKWFDRDNLPDNLIDSRQVALNRFGKNGVFYQEFGWQ